MDEIVRQALAKWPNVPHCYGWLGLDARGDWYLRDAAAQAAGTRGSRIEHAALRAFIERNYEHDADGCWYFQNGPQRVYVELEAAPWVWRLPGGSAGDRHDGVATGTAPGDNVAAHTGRPARVSDAWLDDAGRLFLTCDIGYGLVHTADMDAAADVVAAGRWKPQALAFDEMPARFGYVLSPHARRRSSGG